jgi:[protein-PII] uridylyltransferase
VAKPPSDDALRERTAAVDAAVESAWREHLAQAFPDGMALVAVGGYGRRELFPHSDVDLLLLMERDLEGEPRKAALSAFLRVLWDAKLRVSQSVRTLSQSCNVDPANIEGTITLFDHRFLTGDQKLYGELAQRLPRVFQSQRLALMRSLTEMAKVRHGKYQGTIFHLEPNVKEGPGGIRDLHMIQWLAALGIEAPGSLDDARLLLFDVRRRLHEKYGRDANVLSFEAQDEIADDPRTWMQAYYRAARQIHRAVLRQMELAEALTENQLMRQFRDWRSRLSNPDFTVSRERVFFRSPQQLSKDPGLLFRLFAFVARHGVGLALETERRIAENLAEVTTWASSTGQLWPAFREILSLPQAATALRAMHETGVLTAVFPEWRPIECLVVRDFYHRYTVDEHTLVAIEAVTGLRECEDDLHKRFADLLAETEDVPLVLAALLFHDVGKASGFENHAARSVEIGVSALRRIGMPEESNTRVQFLIENHLGLSAVMIARDINDPQVVRDVAARVSTIENLKALTLLTFADIAAVNPTALTPWRVEQLWRTYLHVYRELTRELETERAHSVQSPFLEGLPVRYLRTHSEEQVRSHMLLDEQSRHTGVAVDLKRRNGVYDLTVVTADRPRLFASLAGALSALGMDIVKAEAFANRAGRIVDTFVFSDPMRTLELNPAETDRLKLTVQRVASGKEDVRRLLKARARPLASRPKPHFAPSVAFDSTASDSATLIEVVAEDRPGLLYELASTMSDAGCNIEVVLIDTQAHRALDVFYVTADGGKLSHEREAELQAALLKVCGGDQNTTATSISA